MSLRIHPRSNSTATRWDTRIRRCRGQKTTAAVTFRPHSVAGLTPNASTPPELKDMVQAYIYGYPMLVMAQTRTSALCEPNASVNSFDHFYDAPDFTFRDVVRPNVDTLYSSAFLDLSDGPVVLTIPPTDGRYLLVALFDAWTNNFAGASTLDVVDGEAGGTFVVALEGWEGEVPTNATRFDSPTLSVWMLIRTEVLGDDDVPQANAIQDAMILTPLTSNSNSNTSSNDVHGQCPDDYPPEAVKKLSGVEFFSKLSKLLGEHGALLPADVPMLRTLAPLGVGPLATFAVEDLRTGRKAQLQVATNAAQKLMTIAENASSSSSETGWYPRPGTVPLGDYGDQYFVRALTSSVGIGANREEFAVYQNADTDEDGLPLSGEASAVYHLTFPRSEEPPVDGFWSVTVYDAEGYLTANELGRYALGSNSSLVKDRSGAMVLTLSHESPSRAAGVPKENWLPIPDAPFQLTLRMYGPTEAVLAEEWTPPRPQLQPVGFT